ncbi:phage portal protein [Streptomyces sp. NPDC059499]|uniref:phage portal protein n=1 Tax=Streptomyces sp. NPDC059499 TaxID=3346852 RepID=UPI0036C939F2
MPLPTADTTWPPTDPTVQSHLADWSAWYSGDPDALEQRYGGHYAGYDRPNRPAQRSGGVRGLLARWWWGTPTPEGERRTKLHIPLAGDIARTSSELLFSEPPTLLSDNEATQTRLDDLMDSGLQPTLLEGGEVCAATGGSYLRVVWDDEVSDRPWIDVVAGDCAVPEFRYGRLIAVTFWTLLAPVDGNDKRVFRHLERHEKGRIFHGLYEGSLTHLGNARPLPEHPATAPLATEVDAEGGLDTGAPDHLTAAYVPNVRPARGWRNIPSAAGWGQSDYQGIEGIMDALDETYSSWMRDIRLGKGRILIADTLLQSNGPGAGASVNIDQEVYAGLNMLPRAGDPNPITDIQFAIRVAEHRDTCQDLIGQAVRQAGYSASTFGDSGDGTAVTATEIRARERRSMSTRARKALYWGPGIGDIVGALLAVEAGPRFGVAGLDLEPVKVEFQDSISEGTSELATTAELLRRAEAASTDTLVRMLHPDWDDEQIKAETGLIKGEAGRDVADPFATGAEGEGVPHAGVPSDGGGPRD